MSADTDQRQPELSHLINGIFLDACELLHNEARLLRVELQAEVSKARGSAEWFGVAAALGVASVVLLGFALAYFLYAPVTHMASATTVLPLWVCFLICSAIMGVGSYGSLYLARKGLQQVDFTPHHTLASLGKGIRWNSHLTH